MPGTEPPRDPARWGIAITDAQIKELIKQRFGHDVPYRVKVLAGFSTGGCGLHQTLLHDLIAVNQVERLVYFDCLYEMQCDATPASLAIKELKSKAPATKVVVYKTSEWGNEYVPGSNYGRLTVPTNNPLLFDSRGIIGNLFQKSDYISVVVFRSLLAAALDKIVSIPQRVEKAFDDLAMALATVPRGSFISNKVAFDFVHQSGTKSPPSGKTFFEDWAVANQGVLKAFASHLGSVQAAGSFRHLLWKNTVPGWSGGDGEEKHDLLIPEFGWEFLT